ncbi:MAG: tRNA uridine(34) 5-carboxymethylaminomethyl modification radical SAM/GNAT enzyme Elp3 [Candidatus Pacearchaeota archaeon]
MLIPKPNEIRKPTKTISGVTPVAVMLPPRKCKHGTCVYCPSLNVPQSYTPKSPVVMRASLVNYDSYKQVKGRLEAFKAMNHPTDKIEIIIMGGTFLSYPRKFQYEFVKRIYNGLNNFNSKDLEKAKKKNEIAEHRCVALCIETRPDVCVEYIDRMREFGCTRVELGVQIIDDKIYKKINRGHSVEDVVKATKKLKDAGFKVGYHIMPGLPGSNIKNDLKLFKKIFSDERFKPDQIKIYPCQVMPGSELENWYWKRKYKPYTKEQIENILIEMFKIVPRYCRVMRVMREIPPDYIVAGTTKIDLRKDVEEELRKNKIKLKEIRYREVGFNLRNLGSLRSQIDGSKLTLSDFSLKKKDKQRIQAEQDSELRLKVTKYRASGGEEYFLEIVDADDILFGLLRLRIFDNLRSQVREIDSSEQTSSSSSLKKIVNTENKKFSVSQIPNKLQGVCDNKKYLDKIKLPLIKYFINNFNAKNLSEAEFGAKNIRAKRGNFPTKVAIIRELHVYGQALNIGQKGKIGQHIGLGKWLLEEAEKIVKEEGIKKLKIISGVGVREYYKKLGYELEKGEGEYLVKGIK